MNITDVGHLTSDADEGEDKMLKGAKREKKSIEALRKQLPEEDEVQCPNCNQFFYDEFNLICLASLNYCLLCANKKVDKAEIKEKYHVE